MPTLLAITASPRGDYSISNTLTATFVDTWKQNYHGTVVTRDLFKTELPFVDVPWIMGAYTPADQHSDEVKKAIAISDTLVAELLATDHIVIGTPMYNFQTPAILKAWIDHVVRLGLTFSPQYEGLVKGKKVTVIIAAGGQYGPGSPLASYNSETSYLKQVLGFLGMTDVTVILAGGTGDIDRGNTTKEAVLAEYSPTVIAAAK